MRFEIVPHERAPTLSGPEGPLVMEQIQSEMASGNFASGNETLRALLRECCLVNLWFFLKFVVGFNQPFDELNDGIHLEMCNFRQSLMYEGARGAIFVPRGYCKTKIVTEGGSAWELMREPNLRIRISNAIADKAQDFMLTVERIFDSNEMVAWLAPEYCPSGKDKWNEKEMVVPCRTRKYREASIETGGVGGSAEGHHYDLHVADDLIGLDALNAAQQSAAVMATAKKWFWGNEKTLLVRPRRSRVIVVGTRYATDDLYQDILERTCELTGHEPAGYEESETGTWRVYYRTVKEDGVLTNPEQVNDQDLSEMDDWTRATQYENEPTKSGLAEFSEYEVPQFRLVWDDKAGWCIIESGKRIRLEGMDVVVAGDPAATERYVSAKTSRSAVGVLAMDSEAVVRLLWLRADYVQPSRFIQWLFDGHRKFVEYVRVTTLEAQGGFKVMGDWVREKEGQQNYWLGLNAVPAVGDKDARIRSDLEPLLNARRFRVEEGTYSEIMTELRPFPQSVKKDILDMCSLGVRTLVRPMTESEQDEIEEAEEEFELLRSPVTGY